MHPHTMLRKLKGQSDYFNRQEQTLAGLLRGDDPEQKMPLGERLMWDRMRMDPTDIADITGTTYTYLVNGHGPQENWTGLFRPGERVRLREIGRASCRERVCQYVEISVGAVALKTKRYHSIRPRNSLRTNTL